MEKQGIIFISGGVRSGKSSFAERLASGIAGPAKTKLHYIAPGQASDSEMAERIARHQKGRNESGINWVTWERAREIHTLAPHFSPDDVVLLDCLTTLLNNEFFYGEWEDPEFREWVASSIIEAIMLISVTCKSFIVISNEVFHGMPADNELVFCYMSTLGRIHQEVVSKARQAYLIEAGVPLLMKGALG